MLKVKKNIKLTGESHPSNSSRRVFRRDRQREPGNISISNWQIDKDLYKKNRTQCARRIMLHLWIRHMRYRMRCWKKKQPG